MLRTVFIVFVLSTAIAKAEPLKPLVSLELFTSQSCYSCPPAEALLGKLADRDKVLAIEWHVDYWDDLVYGSKGRWKDIYSKPEFTQRQRAYNTRLRGTTSVYTPQLIVNGQTEVVGSRPNEVLPAVARAEERLTSPIRVVSQDDRLVVSTQKPVVAKMILMERRRVVDVTHGENAGKTLSHTNAVLEMQKFELSAGESTLPLLQVGENQACGLLIQDGDVGDVLFAAKCS